MKKTKNKKLLIGILFTLFVAVSFCIPKVEKVSADTCNGDVVTFYFLFSEGLHQSATYSDSTNTWTKNSTTMTGTSSTSKLFKINQESDFDWDQTTIIEEGKIEVGNSNGTNMWSKSHYWTNWDRLQTDSEGYKYYYDRTNHEAYAAAVKWQALSANTNNTGVIAKDPSKREAATMIATNITTISRNDIPFNPINSSFSDGRMGITFQIERKYDSASPAITLTDCPENQRYDSSGNITDIQGNPFFCYHNAVYYIKICGTKNGESQSQSTTPEPETYELRYDANGGKNAPSTSSAVTTKTITIKGGAGAPNRDGYTFLGWAETKSAKEADPDFAPGQTYRYTGVKTKTIYAVWEKEVSEYTLIYDANGGKNAPASVTKPTDESITITDKEPTRDGYIFIGWAETPTATSTSDGFDPGDKYAFDGEHHEKTIYAVWVKKNDDYILRYDPNGGQGAPDPQMSQYGDCIKISSGKPTFEGLTFLGWSTDKNAVEPDANYAAGKEYCGELGPDATLYAVWQTNTGVGNYAMVAGILALAAGAGLLLVKRTNIFKQI